MGLGEGLVHAEAADLSPEQEYPQQHPHVADAGDDECFLGRFFGRRSFVPEADKQVGANANQLPGHVEQQEVVGQHQGQHGTGEKSVDRVVPAEPGIPAHVPQGVDLHHQRNKGDQANHHDGERIDKDAPTQGHAPLQPGKARLKPIAVVIADQGLGGLADGAVRRVRRRIQEAEQHHPEQHKPGADGGNRGQGGQEAAPTRQIRRHHHQRRCGKAQNRNQPGECHAMYPPRLPFHQVDLVHVCRGAVAVYP